MKGGQGTTSVATPDGLVVGALVVVNAFGDVVNNVTGNTLAGLRTSQDGLVLERTTECIKMGYVRQAFGMQNTTLAVVATNARLDKRDITKVAQMAQGGLMKTVSPAHTTFDGDLIFGVSLGDVTADVNRVGVLGEFVVAEAIKRAIKKAEGFGILPAFRDISRGRQSGRR
jgi:L-aminopeptidase/D-esterase-like protein